MPKHSLRCPLCGKFSGIGHVCPPLRSMGEVRVTKETKGLTVGTMDKRILTVDELLEKAKINRDEWEIVSQLVNQWEMAAKDDITGEITVQPLYQVKATLKPLHSVVISRALIEDQILDMATHAPNYPKNKYPQLELTEAHLLEICIFDLHFGLVTHAIAEGSDYNIRTAKQLFHDSIKDLLAKSSGFPIGQILLPIGNDLLHFDRPANNVTGVGAVTTKGTVLAGETEIRQVFRECRSMLVDAIDRLSEIAPTYVVVVPGNHDQLAMFYLGDSLEAWYRNTDDVVIMNSLRPRKYVVYGDVLLGFAHGNVEKHTDLPMIMAQEEPQGWANTTYREWHVGHYHKARTSVRHESNEHIGVRIRQIPSLAPMDTFHTQRGYIQTRTAEAYLWDVHGFVGMFSTNAKA